MTRPPARLPDGPRISDLVTLGVLTTTVPAALINAVLVATQRQSQRHRQLPAPLVMYYVMALALSAQASYGEVLRCLLEGVRWLRRAGWGAMGGDQVGHHPCADPAGGHANAGVVPAGGPSHCGPRHARSVVPGRRLVSVDGTTIDLLDTPEMAAEFGRPGASRGASSFPALRLVGLIETGTHAMFAVAVGRYDTSEVRLTPRVLQHLQPNMVCLADWLFVGFELWRLAVATGADLLWRVRINHKL